MIKSVKASTPILTLILFVFAVGYTFAANKVVVIPLGGDISAKEFNQQHVWSGRVIINAKHGTGLYTVEHVSTGKYRIHLNIDGYNLKAVQPSPVVTLWGSSSGHVRVASIVTMTSGGMLIASYFTVQTFDSTFVLANRPFTFNAKFDEPNPPATAEFANAEFESDNEAACNTVGEITTCVFGEN